MRIPLTKRLFHIGYMAHWSNELFTTCEVHSSGMPMYQLIVDLGEMLDGTYKPELQKVSVPKDKVYRVE